MKSKKQYREVLKRLKTTYKNTPDAFVRYSNTLELLIGTVLSAQCTDKRVNKVTLKLFKRYKTALDYKNANIIELKKIIYSTGFYNSKARYLKGIGKMLVDNFNGKVPANHDNLMSLPGVSNKTANLVMAKGFGINIGVAVDTHVKRIATRLGWTHEHIGRTNPTKNTKIIERDLNLLIDKKDYLNINEYLILLGRDKCTSNPKCVQCPLADICPTGKKYVSKK